MVGLSRFELLTPRLSSVCSNQLSYRPLILENLKPAVVLRSLHANQPGPWGHGDSSELVKEPEINRFPQN